MTAMGRWTAPDHQAAAASYRRQIETLLHIACQLVAANNGIDRVEIVSHLRPTIADLDQFQAWARDHQAQLDVDHDGLLIVRSTSARKD